MSKVAAGSLGFLFLVFGEREKEKAKEGTSSKVIPMDHGDP